jgi:small subunit ribosomal protein S7
MPRRAAAGIRPIEADPVYNSRLVQQIINKVMVAGKKSLSEQIVYDALDLLSKRSNKEPVESLEQSIAALTPNLEVRSRRVGGATYQVPVEVRTERRQALAIRWIIDAARKRGEHTMEDRLSNELMDAVNNRGAAVKKREDTHRMAEANKAFSHYRW